MKPLLFLDKLILKFIWKNKQVLKRQFSMGFSCFWVSRSSDYLCSRLSLQGCLCSEHTWKVEVVSPSGEQGKFAYWPVE